jgi:hypothetical protein
MTRREYTIRYACAVTGCSENYRTVADTRALERDIRDRYAKHPWRCTRHTYPDEVLSTSNSTRTTVLTAERSKRYPDLSDLFWSEGSGFQHGPGFKAYAKDFPPGTKLIVTARIELPEDGDTDE